MRCKGLDGNPCQIIKLSQKYCILLGLVSYQKPALLHARTVQWSFFQMDQTYYHTVVYGANLLKILIIDFLRLMGFPQKPLKTPRKHRETLQEHHGSLLNPIQTHSITKGSQDPRKPLTQSNLAHSKAFVSLSFAIPKIYGPSLTISSQIHHANNCQQHRNLNRSH